MADWKALSEAEILAKFAALATVANTGSYTDLTDKPTIPDPFVATGAIVSRSTTQAVDNTTDTPVQFTTEDKDDSTYFDSGANTKLTVPATGWYIVSGGVDWSSNTPGTRYMHLKVNNTTFTSSVSAGAGVGDLRQHTTGLFYFTANDYIEVVIFQTSGGQISIDAARMALVRVG